MCLSACWILHAEASTFLAQEVRSLLEEALQCYAEPARERTSVLKKSAINTSRYRRRLKQAALPIVTDLKVVAMANPSIEKEDQPLTRIGASAQRYARIAGVLILVSLVAGGFGEYYVPSKLIASDSATVTAHNIMSSQTLFRLGFAGYLVEAVCDLALTLVFYVLLRPVDNDIALLAVLFRILATATFAFSEFFYFAAYLILGGASYLRTFSSDELNSLALLSLKLYGHVGELFLVFYGVGSAVLGYLIVRSGYLPKGLGVLLSLGGLGFIIMNFTLLLAPAYASNFLLLPTTIGMLLLAVWLLVRGVDVTKWEEKAAANRIG